MGTKIITLPAEERQQRGVDLLTRTTVTKQNYYSLYVTNLQVNCICRIWNRIVYCLFSWLGWFLGKAGDVNDKISMRQENPLIQNYNQAKKTLLEAVNKKTGSYPEAEKNYIKALNARVGQINTFGYSAEATQQGCKIEKGDLLEAATADLRRALKEGIDLPQSLQNMLRPGVQSNPQPSPIPPPKEDPVKKKALDARKALVDELVKTPYTNEVDKVLITNYIEAFKAYQASARTKPDDFTLFYTELTTLCFSSTSSHPDRYLPLLREFAGRFDLPMQHPLFLRTYSDLVCNWYIEAEFRFIQDSIGAGKCAHLQIYANEMRAIHVLTYPGGPEPGGPEIDTNAFVTSALSNLLYQIGANKEVSKGYAALAARQPDKALTSQQEQALYLAKLLACLAQDPLPPETEELRKKVLTSKPEDLKGSSIALSFSSSLSSSTTSASRSASTSASTSESASSSVSSSSTTSPQPVPASTSEKPKFDLLDFYEAQNDLVGGFVKAKKRDLIENTLIEKYVQITRLSKDEQYPDLRLALEDLESAIKRKINPPQADEILKLKTHIAKELGIDTPASVSTSSSESTSSSVSSSSTTVEPVPASTSSSTSRSASSNASSSSTTSQPVLESTNKQTFTLAEFLSARDALVKEFVEKQKVELITQAHIEAFVKATKRFRATGHFTKTSQFSYVLNELETKIIIQDRPPNPHERLTLKIRLAKELDICTDDFFSQEIALMIETSLTDTSFLFHPSQIREIATDASRPTSFSDYYTTIKGLSAYVKPDGDCAAYAKEKLKQLFTAVYDKERNTYSAFAGEYHDAQHNETIATLVRIAKALPGFRKAANSVEKELAGLLLAGIIQKAENPYQRIF